ncbi:MAG TPA: ABC transporter ATP-binding protein [Candidatus Limnocylindria bacterium]|nr:ABC transporter ATP-binding protein [Candidatus Limnocylindria bacterium]
MTAIEVRGLRKSYGALEAVRGIDLDIQAGEVFALLGPNGAGKTTTVEILEGYRGRDGGEVSVLGIDPARQRQAGAMRARIGIVLQSTGVSPYLTVRETVAMFAGYYPHPRDVDEVIGLAGLTEQADRRINKLSGGQRRRVDLAVALAGDPELLFLDEPTTGFDPSARRAAWDVVRSLSQLGKTVFLTTHYMDEAQALADRVAIIAAGRIVASGTPDTLGSRGAGSSSVRFGLPHGAELPDGFGARRTAEGYELETGEPTRLLHDLTSWALSADVELTGLEVSRPSLEDVYLALTGEAEAA